MLNNKKFLFFDQNFFRLLFIIFLLFIADSSHAKKAKKINLFNQYDDNSKPKLNLVQEAETNQPVTTQTEHDKKTESKTPDTSESSVSNLSEQKQVNQPIENINPTKVENSVSVKEQIIKVEKNVDLAAVDTSKLSYVPWRVGLILGNSQISVKDLESKTKAQLLSDVNYTLSTQYFISINKTNQISLQLDNYLEKYKNFSSLIQLSQTSIQRNEIQFAMNTVIQNELILRYGFALKQSVIAYALNSKFIELQSVPHSAINFEIRDRLFEYDQINLVALAGFELHLSAQTQDYKLDSGSCYYLSAKINHSKIKNPSTLGIILRQQNATTNFSSQTRTDMNFSVGAEF